MHSAIYIGHLRHRRLLPVPNHFGYGVFFVFADLAEINQAFRASPLWSVNRFNLACFCRKDHFGDPAQDLDTAVRDLVAGQTGTRPAGPIRLLCHWRYFGHCFNPASFYYCYKANGIDLQAIVVEIHNTPWGEVHCYVLPQSRSLAQPPFHRFELDKSFHVSPFMDMDMHYNWRFRQPGQTLSVHMESCRRHRKFFDATLTLQRHEISRRLLNRLVLAPPPMTVKVIAMIYWQALRLWHKKTPFYVHPRKRQENPK